MARPVKNYCDYFSHDRDMRNHKKIKAIRTKFGITGYGIWCMVLEYLTGNDGNVFEYSDLEFELMSGDFGVSVTEIRDTVDYCIKLELLFLKDGFINSESLDERLKSVYDKRGVAKVRSAKQGRDNGKFARNNPDGIGITVTEMPQSKVKESKENQKKENAGNFEKKIGSSKEQVLFENPPPDPDSSIIGQMWGIWKQTFPKYTSDRELDFRGLGQIFAFMCKQSGNNHDPTNIDFQISFLNTFQVVADEVAKNNFWVNMPISSIAKNIQLFYNNIKNPINGNTETKPGKRNGEKLSMDKIKEAHARRYGNGE